MARHRDDEPPIIGARVLTCQRRPGEYADDNFATLDVGVNSTTGQLEIFADHPEQIDITHANLRLDRDGAYQFAEAILRELERTEEV